MESLFKNVDLSRFSVVEKAEDTTYRDLIRDIAKVLGCSWIICHKRLEKIPKLQWMSWYREPFDTQRYEGRKHYINARIKGWRNGNKQDK